MFRIISHFSNSNFIYFCPSYNCVTLLAPVQLLIHTTSQIFLLNCYLHSCSCDYTGLSNLGAILNFIILVIDENIEFYFSQERSLKHPTLFTHSICPYIIEILFFFFLLIIFKCIYLVCSWEYCANNNKALLKIYKACFFFLSKRLVTLSLKEVRLV